MKATIKVLQEVPKNLEANNWNLCLQKVIYQYDNGDDDEIGFRFIWRRPDGTLQAARGQARIPSLQKMMDLINAAAADGFFT